LTLPTLIRRLGLEEDEKVRQEEALARRAAVDAALGRIDTLAREEDAAADVIDLLRQQYAQQADLLRATDGAAQEDAADAAAHERLRREVLSAQRAALLRLRDEGAISDEVLRDVQRDLDLEEARLEP
jgi:CPA1 family monovalent cation:H+ antiporter